MAGLRTLNTRLTTAEAEIKKVRESIKPFPDVEKIVLPMIRDVEKKISAIKIPTPKDYTEDLKELEDRLEAVKRLAVSRPGGNANRNIAVGGNTSVLQRYTDINIKPGNNITLTYSNNDTTKYLDLTITGSGSGSGITRQIDRTSVSSTIGATASIDYVAICTAGVQITLPTAVGNDNLYTVKNVAASSVLIGTTASQTIDGDATLTLGTQYTAVDLVNDGNDNWSIT